MGANTKTVTDASFAADVLQSDKPVLVDFWAEWCGPCKMVAPVLEEIAGENADKLTVVKLNIDENPERGARLPDHVHPHDGRVPGRQDRQVDRRRQAEGRHPAGPRGLPVGPPPETTSVPGPPSPGVRPFAFQGTRSETEAGRGGAEREQKAAPQLR